MGNGGKTVTAALKAMEGEGFEPSVPVEDGSFWSPPFERSGPRPSAREELDPAEKRGNSGARYMGFAALNPCFVAGQAGHDAQHVAHVGEGRAERLDVVRCGSDGDFVLAINKRQRLPAFSVDATVSEFCRAPSP
jgi:hypothetical protein